jgi:hypothetical protein
MFDGHEDLASGAMGPAAKNKGKFSRFAESANRPLQVAGGSGAMRERRLL